MKLCIIHAGQPKTGTTALQAALSASDGWLLRNGILYPTLGRPPGQRRQHGNLVREISDVRRQRAGGSLLPAFLDEIARVPHEVLLLSAEFLFRIMFFSDRAAVQELLRAQGYAIETLTFLRDQPDFLNSAYAQYMRNARDPLSFDEFIASRSAPVNAEGQLEPLYYGRLTDPVHTAWGRHSFLPYTAAVRAGGIQHAFLAAVEPVLARHGFGGWLVPPEALAAAAGTRRNVSDGPVTIAAARRIARRLTRSYHFSELRDLSRGTAVILRRVVAAAGIAETPYCALTPERHARIRAIFRDSNAAFAATFWGRPWEEVFPARDPVELRCNDIDETGDPAMLRLVGHVVETTWPQVEELVRSAAAARAAAGDAEGPGED
jgi:hypothetical protein